MLKSLVIATGNSISIILPYVYLHLDYTVGKIAVDDFPPEHLKEKINMFLERFRRVLMLYPEFSERLSDFDRSALWRSNYLMAAALASARVNHKKTVFC